MSVRRRVCYPALLLTCLAVAVFSPAPYLILGIDRAAQNGNGLAGAYADRPEWVHGVLLCHIVSAGIALGIGGFQFSGWLRTRSPRWHRVIGWLYVGAVLPGALSGLVLAAVGSAGPNGFFGFGTLAILWCAVTVAGVRSIRAGRVDEHRAWMIRGFALTYAAVTLRMWQLILMGILAGWGAAGDRFAMAYAAVPFLCWLPNIVVAELLIARLGLPGLRYVRPSPRGAA